MKQRESVFNAVVSVIGEVSGKVELSKEQRSQVIEMVTESIISGETDFSAEAREKHDTREKVKTYVNGLVSNWLRKDVRLNGGEKYEAKNPGSRAGRGDEMLRNLKALQSTLTDSAQKEVVQAEIDKRIAELQATKVKKVEIDITKIPEELRHLIPSAS